MLKENPTGSCAVDPAQVPINHAAGGNPANTNGASGSSNNGNPNNGAGSVNGANNSSNGHSAGSSGGTSSPWLKEDFTSYTQ